MAPGNATWGRHQEDARVVLNGILWIDRPGAPWRDLPERYGPWPTVASRFYRWQRAGVWASVLAALQAETDAAGRLDRDQHYLDTTVERAHQHAAGAKGRILRPRRWDGARAGSARSCTSAPKAEPSRSRSSSRRASGTKPPP